MIHITSERCLSTTKCIVLVIFCLLPCQVWSGFDDDMDFIYIEGSGGFDDRTGRYYKSAEMRNGKPQYVKGAYKLYYNVHKRWRLVEPGKLHAISNEDNIKYPWMSRYSNALSVNANRVSRWGDSYTISFNFNSGLESNAKRYLLRSIGTNKATLKPYNMFQSLNSQPRRTAWRIFSVSPSSDFFVIGSIYNRKFLAMDDSGKVFLREIPDCIRWDCITETSHHGSQWRIEAASDQGDMVLIHRKKIAGKERILRVVEEPGTDELALTMITADEVGSLTNDILFNINHRFIRMYIHPNDLNEQNGRLALTNDVKVTRLFIPSPSADTEKNITRRYSIKLVQKEIGAKYTFVAHIGKPDEGSASQYQQRLNDLVDEAMNFRVVKNNNLTQEDVRHILHCQLSNSFHNEGNFTRGIVWIPETPVDVNCSLSNVDVFNVESDLKEHWYTRLNGVEMKIIKDVRCKSNENSSSSYSCHKSDYFGFLIKENRDGVIKFRIYDPTDLTGVDPN